MLSSDRGLGTPVASWDFAITIDRREALPIFLQIARSISDDVRRDRLRPGARLPACQAVAR